LRAAGLREAFEDTDGRLPRTFPSPRPLLPVDRIYVRDAQVVATDVLRARPWSRLSDHCALLAEIRF